MSRIFDDYSDVKECTTCEHWWTNACDGNIDGAARPCNGYLAIRKVTIPEDIEQLNRRVNRVQAWLSVVSGALLGLIGVIVHWLS